MSGADNPTTTPPLRRERTRSSTPSSPAGGLGGQQPDRARGPARRRPLRRDQDHRSHLTQDKVACMVAQRKASQDTRPRPEQNHSEAMASARTTSSEGSARTPVRDPRAGEEQEEVTATPISADSATRPAEMSVQSPLASDISGFGTEATDPEDEPRPVTKPDFTKFRHRVEETFQRMYADAMGLLQ